MCLVVHFTVASNVILTKRAIAHVVETLVLEHRGVTIHRGATGVMLIRMANRVPLGISGTVPDAVTRSRNITARSSLIIVNANAVIFYRTIRGIYGMHTVTIAILRAVRTIEGVRSVEQLKAVNTLDLSMHVHAAYAQLQCTIIKMAHAPNLQPVNVARLLTELP